MATTQIGEHIPDPYTTEFTVTLPCDIRPTRVWAGFDAPADSPYHSFGLSLRLDWRADAPRIQSSYIDSIQLRDLAVPHQNVRLAVGGPLSDPDVYDDSNDNNSLTCDVRWRPSRV